MKKSITILLMAVMLAVTAIPCYAVQVIGQVLSTDIRAYINGAEIPAYNIDGKLAVVVSDLNNYGFKTSYNNDLRKSSVTRNPSATTFNSVPSKASGLPIGSRVMDVYQSDITVELDGVQVQAFNVDNRMAIYFNELKKYGSYTYDNNSRSSIIVLSNSIPTKEVPQSVGGINNINRPQRSSYSNNTITVGLYQFQAPDFWIQDYSVDYYRSYAETNGKVAMLYARSNVDQNDPVGFYWLDTDAERNSVIQSFFSGMESSGSHDFELLKTEIIETADIKGVLWSFRYILSDRLLSGYILMFPSEENNHWVTISCGYSDNTQYCYDDTFRNTIYSIKKINTAYVPDTSVTRSYQSVDSYLQSWYAGVPLRDSDNRVIFFVNTETGKIHQQSCKYCDWSNYDWPTAITSYPDEIIALEPGFFSYCQVCCKNWTHNKLN